MPLPPRSRKKLIKIASAATIGIIALTAFVLRDVARELWYIHLLGSGDGWRQRDAIEALGEMASRRAIPHLVELIREKGELGEFGEMELDRSISRALARTAPEGIEALIELLADPNPDVQGAGLEALTAMGPDASAAVPAVARCLQSQNEYVPDRAIEALAALGPEAKSAIPAVIEAMERGNPDDLYPDELFSKFPDEVSEQLIRALEFERRGRRVTALRLLGESDPVLDGPRVVSAVAPFLDSEDEEILSLTVAVLSVYASRALQALPRLLELLRSSEEPLREEIGWTIREMGTPTIPDLLPLLKATDERDVRFEILGILRTMEIWDAEAYRSTVGAVIACLSDRRSAVRCHAILALNELKPIDRESISSLRSALEARKEEARVAVLDALREIEREVSYREAYGTQLNSGAAEAPNAERWVLVHCVPPLLDGYRRPAKELVAERTVLRNLRSKDRLEQRLALHLVAEKSWQNANALEAVVAILRQIPELRKEALRALRHRAAVATESVSENAARTLLDLLDDPDPGIRLDAAMSIWAVQIESYEATLPVILRAARNGRHIVAPLLRRAERKPILVDAVISLLDGLHERSRFGAESIARTVVVSLRDRALPPLIAATRNTNGWARRFAIRAIRDIEVTTDAVVECLVDCFTDSDLRVRGVAVEAMIGLSPSADHVLDALTAILDDEDEALRTSALECLARLKADALPSLAAIEKCLTDENDAVRIAAARAHRSASGAARRTKGTLVEIAGDRSSANRHQAIQALGDMDAEDLDDVIPVLVGAVENGTIQAVYDALELLLKVDPSPGEYLALAVRRAREANERNILEFLAWYIPGPRGQSAIPALIPLVKDWDSSWRVAAIDVLGAIGADPERVVPVLISALGDRDATVRSAATIALEPFASGHGIVSHLLRAAKDPDSDVRGSAFHTLSKLGSKAPKIVDVLIAGLRDPHFSVRQDAVYALSELGVASTPVIDALEKVSRGGDTDLRQTALTVLKDLRSARQSSPESE